jgi:branched-chain amino acid aminotransferase
MVQAKKDQYDNAIILNSNGKVAEGPGACLFLVRKGKPLTVPVTSGILESITRETIIRLLKEYFDLEAEIREIDRTELYVAEEAFICGSGYEITPILSIDKFKLNEGQVGPLTKKIQKLFLQIVRGEIPDHPEWRTPVYKRG